METLNLWVGIGQIISVTIIPLVAWWFGIKYQNRKSKKDTQLKLFLTLMENRKPPVTKEWVDALNTIDIVFQEDKKIRQSWRDYFDSLNEKSSHFDKNNAFLLDLLSEMAQVLGYKNLKQTEIDRFYSPVHFANKVGREDILYSENLRVLTHSKNLAEPFSEEEYQEHMKKINKN